jgi:protein-disulfide isomerase
MTELKSNPEKTPRPTQLAVPVDPARDHLLGAPNAPVTVLEYGDYECPDCGRAYPLLKKLQARYPNKVLFVFRHFPLFTVHQHASMAAQAAEAAAAQKKFWEMHNLLYEHQVELANTDLTHHALKLGLELYRFDAALGDGTYRRRVEEDYASGQRSGVTATPTLFINGAKYEGPMELEALSKAIDNAIK